MFLLAISCSSVLRFAKLFLNANESACILFSSLPLIKYAVRQPEEEPADICNQCDRSRVFQ